MEWLKLTPILTHFTDLKTEASGGWVSQHYTAKINRWGAEVGGGELGFENSGLFCSQVHFFCLIPWRLQWCGRVSNGRLFSSPFSKYRSVLFVLGVERRREWQCYRKSTSASTFTHHTHTFLKGALPRARCLDIKLFERSLFQKMACESFSTKSHAKEKLHPIALIFRGLFSSFS